MKAGLKYCGGCNPRYERRNIVKKMLTDYPEIVCEPIQEDACYDFILVICGCRASCSTYSALEKYQNVIFVCGEEDYIHLKEFIIKLGGEFRGS